MTPKIIRSFLSLFLSFFLSFFLSLALPVAFILGGRIAIGKEEVPNFPLHLALEKRDETLALAIIKERKFNRILRGGVSPFSLAVSLHLPAVAIAIAQAESDGKEDFARAEFYTYYKYMLWKYAEYSALKRAGFHQSLQNQDGLTILMQRIQDRNKAFIPSQRMEEELGALVGETDTGLADQEGNAALHYVMLSISERESLEENKLDMAILRDLFAKGVAVDKANGKGQTALHLAYSRLRGKLSKIQEKHFADIITRLLEHGADPNLRDSQGKSPSELAERKVVLKPLIPREAVLASMRKFYANHSLDIRIRRSGGIQVNLFDILKKSRTSEGQTTKVNALADTSVNPLSADSKGASFHSSTSLFYRIVGKYSSHSPSRASEEPDGFGWW